MPNPQIVTICRQTWRLIGLQLAGEIMNPTAAAGRRILNPPRTPGLVHRVNSVLYAWAPPPTDRDSPSELAGAVFNHIQIQYSPGCLANSIGVTLTSQEDESFIAAQSYNNMESSDYRTLEL